MNRRQFLKLSIMGVAALVIPAISTKQNVYEIRELGYDNERAVVVSLYANGKCVSGISDWDDAWNYVEQRIKPDDIYIETYDTRQVKISGAKFLEERKIAREFDARVEKDWWQQITEGANPIQDIKNVLELEWSTPPAALTVSKNVHNIYFW